jgi:hypothetical protein
MSTTSEHGATTVCEDNQRAIKLANNPMASSTTKHTDIKYHYIWEMMHARAVAVVFVGKAYMMANGLTKAPPEPEHTIIFKGCMGAAPSGV